MKRFSLSILFLAFCLTVVAAIPALAVQNSVMNVRIDKAVAIPGQVLLPGSYTFRLVDSDTYPGFVQILSANGSRNYGFIHVFASKRQNAGKAKLVLSEPDQAGLEHVVSWYFPGQSDGYHFIYSKRELRNADLIAQRMQIKSRAGL